MLVKGFVERNFSEYDESFLRRIANTLGGKLTKFTDKEVWGYFLENSKGRQFSWALRQRYPEITVRLFDHDKSQIDQEELPLKSSLA